MKKNVVVVHPFFFFIFPLLALYSKNLSHVTIADLGQPILFSLLGFLGVGVVLWAIFRSWSKVSVVLSLMVVLFFSYGAYISVTKDKYMMFFTKLNFDHNFYLYVSLILVLWVGYKVYKSTKKWINMHKILNLIGILLLAQPLFLIGNSMGKREKRILKESEISNTENQKYDKDFPPIYYFILDAYGRDDILKSHYNYENELTKLLKKRAFFVAEKANSNYNQTILSLPSSLNMSYLEEFIDGRNTEDIPRESIIPYFLEAKVLKLLKQNGYYSYTFDGQIYEPVMLKSVDSIMSTNTESINLYKIELFKTSILNAFKMDFLQNMSNRKNYDSQREKILNSFESIEKLSASPQRNFVFGHILSPHQPFIFEKDGQPRYPEHDYSIWYTIEEGRDAEAYKIEYINQLQFINQKMIATIDTILKNTNRNAIIIIQGDHGPSAGLCCTQKIEGNDFCERMGILNAFYFPDKNYHQLSKDISPVNNFRVIFNQYFGENFPLLENRSYFSTWGKPFDFFDVTDTIQQNDFIE